MKVICVNNGNEKRDVNRDVTIGNNYVVIHTHANEYFLVNDRRVRLLYPKDMFETLEENRNKKLSNILL